MQEHPEWLHLVQVCSGAWLVPGSPHLVRGWRILVGEVRD